jgi:hypothetical protein
MYPVVGFTTTIRSRPRQPLKGLYWNSYIYCLHMNIRLFFWSACLGLRENNYLWVDSFWCSLHVKAIIVYCILVLYISWTQSCRLDDNLLSPSTLYMYGLSTMLSPSSANFPLNILIVWLLLYIVKQNM